MSKAPYLKAIEAVKLGTGGYCTAERADYLTDRVIAAGISISVFKKVCNDFSDGKGFPSKGELLGACQSEARRQKESAKNKDKTIEMTDEERFMALTYGKSLMLYSDCIGKGVRANGKEISSKVKALYAIGADLKASWKKGDITFEDGIKQFNESFKEVKISKGTQ